MRTLRNAGIFSLVALPFGLAFGLAFALVGFHLNSDPLWLDVGFALVYAATITIVPGLVYMSSFPGFPLTVNLAGFQSVLDRRRRHMRFAMASGIASLFAVAAAVIEPIPLTVRALLAVATICAVTAAALNGFRDFHSIRPHKERLAHALANFGANGIIYMARKDGGAYQIAQWLPVLQSAGVRPIIVVREREAVNALRQSMPATVPIVLCVANSDLDMVVTDSLRAVFYVNSVASNSIMVNYLSLTHIYLGHGDSDKEISALPVHRMYDKVFVAGQAALDRYARAGIRLDRDQGVIIGRPQLQAIATAAPERAQSGIKTVLYAPTWGGYNAASNLSSLEHAMPFVRDLLRRDIRILFRPHPLSLELASDRARIKQLDEVLLSAGPQHLLSHAAMSQPLTELFNLSDGLLTDISSMIIDYLASEKPVALIDPHLNISVNEYPSAHAAYLISGENTPAWHDFVGEDSMSESRKNLAAHYIGYATDEKFRTSLRPLLEP